MSASKPRVSVLIDANIFLRLFVRENEVLFLETQEFFRLVEQGTIDAFVPTVAVAEVLFVLSSWYKVSKDGTIALLNRITTSPGIEIFDDLDLRVAVTLYQKSNVKFIDCLLASSNRIQKGEAAILSYDRDFGKLKVKHLEPGQLFKKLKS